MRTEMRRGIDRFENIYELIRGAVEMPLLLLCENE